MNKRLKAQHYLQAKACFASQGQGIKGAVELNGKEAKCSAHLSHRTLIQCALCLTKEQYLGIRAETSQSRTNLLTLRGSMLALKFLQFCPVNLTLATTLLNNPQQSIIFLLLQV